MDDNRPPALPHAGPPPDEDAFFTMAETALATMPEQFRPHIAGLLLSIEDVADAETLESMDIEHPYDLTGLYQGRPLTQKSVEESGGLPDRVTLYRLPLLVEWIESGERLDHLIRHVLIHEIGHHFGLSDDDIDAIESAA
jgi:predicted Zn-dependent protease with MMP-like domain